MTERQRLFAEAYMESKNAVAAAIKAGYNEQSAKKNAYRLLKKEGVRAYIQERERAALNERIADMSEVNEFWTEVMRNENADIKDRMKAAEFRAKAQGAFNTKEEAANEQIGGDTVRVVFKKP